MASVLTILVSIVAEFAAELLTRNNFLILLETTSPVAPNPEVPVTTPTEEKESVQERAARLRKKMEEVHAKKEAQKKEVCFVDCF